MPNISLSQNADKALNHIYKKYQSRKSNHPSDTYDIRAFFIDPLFPHQQESEILPTILELHKNSLIWFFSDKRIILNDKGIQYVENKLENGLISSHDLTYKNPPVMY